MKYVLVKNGKVENVILWDGKSEIPEFSQFEIYQVEYDTLVGVGFELIDGEWFDPTNEESMMGTNQPSEPKEEETPQETEGES